MRGVSDVVRKRAQVHCLYLWELGQHLCDFLKLNFCNSTYFLQDRLKFIHIAAAKLRSGGKETSPDHPGMVCGGPQTQKIKPFSRDLHRTGPKGLKPAT